jgi:plastocyanin
MRVMSRIILAAAVTLCLIAAPGAQGPDWGSITGQVTLKPRIGGAALPSTAYPTRAVGPRDTYPIPEIKNVVVYLKDVTYRGALHAAKAEVRQEHETFVPHVVAITRGSTVEFPNGDPIYHNVFSLSSAGTFNLGRFPRGQTRAQSLSKNGVVKVYCQIHSHMSATILVFDHPYFTIPELNGSFELPNLPPGDYVLVGWHERVGERTAGVHVERGQAASVTLSLPVEDPR